MTANVQNYARQKQIPVDTVQFGHKLLREEPDELTSKPASGCYIYGLFLEGARWDKRNDTLTDPKPKELFAPMPVIHLVPEVDRAPNPENGNLRVRAQDIDATARSALLAIPQISCFAQCLTKSHANVAW